MEIEWLLVAKAAMQTYGTVLQTLIDQQISLDDHISYWDDVSHSHRYGFVYWVQRSPIRLWSFTRDVYVESRRRIQGLYAPASEYHDDPDVDVMSETRSVNGVASISTLSLSQRWAKFYQIVRTTVQDRSLLNIQDQILSPIALCQAEAREKRFAIKRLKENVACSVGTLVDEGLNFTGRGVEWKEVLERSVSLMDMVLSQTPVLDGNIQDFEEKIFRFVDNDPEFAAGPDDATATSAMATRKVATRLLKILKRQIPQQALDVDATIKEHGRPSRWIRFWLPATVGLLSSITIIRMLLNRKEQVMAWIVDLGVTARDFWADWVMEPVRKVIGTIRHDENSEIALMSRDSLRADLESLERMVVDFAVDKPHFAMEGDTSSGLSEAQIADIRAKVNQGDLTPVLRAYEKDLKSPLVGAVRGDLVRALLIQVQKSKVDMEIALSGIDALLKSQELVFGFVGLTPGVLVSIFLFQYLHGVFMGRPGFRKYEQERAVKTTRAIRTIGRMLAKADISGKTLTYEQIGTLLCQAHVLRTVVPAMRIPDDTEKVFLADLDALVSSRAVPIQKKLVDDIALAYQKWIF
jgi:nuclear-control-of-ATPase protein 2